MFRVNYYKGSGDGLTRESRKEVNKEGEREEMDRIEIIRYGSC